MRTFYKAVCHNFTSKYNINFKYTIGEWVSEPATDPSTNLQCGQGIHVARSFKEPIKHMGSLFQPGKANSARLLELTVEDADIIYEREDDDKLRVRRALVVREVSFSELIPNWDTLQTTVQQIKTRQNTYTPNLSRGAYDRWFLSAIEEYNQSLPLEARIVVNQITTPRTANVRSHSRKEGVVWELPETNDDAQWVVNAILQKYLENCHAELYAQQLIPIVLGSHCRALNSLTISGFRLLGVVDGVAYVIYPPGV